MSLKDNAGNLIPVPARAEARHYLATDGDYTLTAPAGTLFMVVELISGTAVWFKAGNSGSVSAATHQVDGLLEEYQVSTAHPRAELEVNATEEWRFTISSAGAIVSFHA